MTVAEIRQKYFDYFKARGHVLISSVPLVPENDPTTLFVGSGMQPLLPYFLGAPHPMGTRVVNAQLAFRAEDIEEIGDNRHTSSFEMLGNWSFGDYFKKEQIPWMFEFLTKELGIDKSKLHFTCFEGDDGLGIPKDTESYELWKSCGVEESHLYYYPAKKNWWSRAGVPANMPPGEPGGPDTEMFFDFGTPHDARFGESCHPNCDCGRFVEIGNNVFMEYIKNADGSFSKLPKANVDFGGGLERIAAAVNGKPDIFLIDTLLGTIRELAAASGKAYDDPKFQKSYRVIADHIKGAVFMIADGVLPSNTEQGYVLRRLIRRFVRHMDILEVKTETLGRVVDQIAQSYKAQYPRVTDNSKILLTIIEEEARFRKTLAQGMKEFERGTDPFILFTTYGFPIELTQELAAERGQTVDIEAFKQAMTKHADDSRAGSEQKFKGGLADTSATTTALHTSTHLMLAALRKFLGPHVHQAGSNITAERTRFDFTHGEKVSHDVLAKVEAYVNEAIEKRAVVTIEQMPKQAARDEGVEGSFWEKYPDVVQVYTVRAPDGTVYSRELCGGPHVEETGAIAAVGTFKIIKEEASSAGVRRIKAVLQK